jgi:threonine dehydratase
LKIVVEPSSAVVLAALIKNKKRFRNKKIGLIMCGGNVDIQSLKF